MVCEFLPKEFKDRLVEMASVEDLVAAGYTPKSASNVKSHKIISDERCDRLVEILGERAHPVLREAFQAFAAELSGLGIQLDSQAQQPAIDTPVLKKLLDRLDALEQRLNELQQSLTGLRPKWTEKDFTRGHSEEGLRPTKTEDVPLTHGDMAKQRGISHGVVKGGEPRE